MELFPVDNPTMSTAEANSEIPRSYLVLPTGVISFILMLVIMVTSLPGFRKARYNVFYFIHVTFAIGILILTCVHASTNFYFLLPGMVLWVADWTWRILYSLKTKEEIKVENAGNGWYRVHLAPRTAVSSVADIEKNMSIDTTSISETPLATYYINIPAVSKVQIHPFTAAAVDPATGEPIILFRLAPGRKKLNETQKEWTRRVGDIADTGMEQGSSAMVCAFP